MVRTRPAGSPLRPSNADNDYDGLLDRHFGLPSYRGSGAWTTNHMSSGDDEDSQWTSFTKIVAAPADATCVSGVWYSASGKEIGPAIWGDFAIIEDVYNSPVEGLHGRQYLSPVGPGFGKH